MWPSYLRRRFVVASALTLCLLLAFEFFTYRQSYGQSLARIDTTLETGVNVVDLIVGEQFHDRNFNADTLPAAEAFAIAEKLTIYAESAGLDYLYTMILDGGVIRFVTSSLTPEKYRQGDIEDYYWMAYPEAPAALSSLFAYGGSVVTEYSDRWGNYRSMFTARPRGDGSYYVIGSDKSLKELVKLRTDALVKLITRTLLLSTLILMWGFTLRSDNRGLKTANRRQTLALSAGSVAIWEWRIDRENLYVSPSLFTSLGFAESEIPKRTEAMIALIDERDRPAFKQRIKDVLSAAKYAANKDEFHFRIQGPGSKTFWLFSRGEVVEWGRNGEPELMVGILENITTTKAYEAALEKSSEESKRNNQFIVDLLNNLPDAVSYKNRDGRYQLCSRSLQVMLGAEFSECLGKTDFDLFPKHVAESLRDNDLRALENEEPIVVCEWVNDASRDEARLLETKKTRIFSPFEHTLGVLSVGRDVTEMHNLLQELKKFKQFIDYSAQGLIIVTVDLEIQFVNPKMCALHGWSAPDSVLGCNLAELASYEVGFKQMLGSRIMPLLLAGEDWSGEVLVHPRGGGDTPTIHSMFAIFSDRSMLLGIGIIATDISGQKKIETELIKSRESADRANHSKSLFLANMSHEIRTPLNSIIGFSQLLAEVPETSGEAKIYVNKIYRAGNRLLNLINDILDLTKIEADKMEVRAQAVNVASEIEEICGLFSGQAEAKSLEFVTRIEGDAEQFFTLDRQKFNQIVVNLLSNAFKYTASGTVTLTCVVKDLELEVWVEDTGPGMSKEELELVARVFEQGDAGKLSGGGTGLGLALSKRLAELMHGEVCLSSRLGEGTRAVLKLPVAKTDPPPRLMGKRLIQGSAKVKGNPLVAVIDDDEDSLSLLATMLRRLGFDAHKFQDPAAAVEAIASGGYGLVCTDIRMPQLDGLGVLHKVRRVQAMAAHEVAGQHMPPGFVPVIAVSASSLLHERAYYLQEGFDDFVSKPVEFDALLQSLVHVDKITLGEAQAVDAVRPVAAAGGAEPTPGALSEPDLERLRTLADAYKQGNYDWAEQVLKELSESLAASEWVAKLRRYTDQYNAHLALAEIKLMIDPACDL